jgi:hypothetical protein
VNERSELYEDDEPIEDVERAFRAGRSVATARPTLTTLDDLRWCPEGTLLRAANGRIVVLAWRVTTVQWSVTGFEAIWSSEHMFGVCDRWEVIGQVNTE